jgi:O-antigen ligase
MIVFSLISIVIITQVYSFMFNKLGEGGSSGINYRLKKIEMAWDMFVDSPIVGNGPGSFLVKAKKRPEREIREHATLESTYPYIAAEFGLLGIICTLITFYIVWKMYTKIPDVKNDIRKKLAKVVMCMCFGVLVAQVGENTIFFPKINWLIGSYIGLLPVLRRLPEKTDNMANYNFRNY